jgi:hypothetical protein
MLIDLVRDAFRTARWPVNHKTGTLMFNLADNVRNVDNTQDEIN